MPREEIPCRPVKVLPISSDYGESKSNTGESEPNIGESESNTSKSESDTGDYLWEDYDFKSGEKGLRTSYNESNSESDDI
ncbi:hypothetical protein RUND412_010278 [Rhizina undulata]